MKTNRAGRRIIESSESFMAYAYTAPEQKGTEKKTIGYGHVILDGETFSEPMTREQADDLLARDLEKAELAVRNAVKVPLTDNQFSALVSLVFNIGADRFKTSAMLRLINTFHMVSAAKEFERYNHAKVKGVSVVLDGLTARRKAERLLFEKEQENAQ